MKLTIAALAAVFTLVGASSGLRAEDDKPLAPGWFSLDGSVGAMDKGIANGKGAVEKALGIGISGFLDSSYTWSSNHPGSPSNISGRYFDKDHNKVVFNYFHLAVEKPEKDWGVGFKLSGDFGRGGELLREATLWGKTLKDEPSAELREAFLTATIPLGEGIGIKGGLFVTPHGTEVIPAPGAYNDNISRSFLFNLAIPFRHLGVMFSYPIHKTVTISAGPVTGWDNPRDNNGQPSVMAGLTFTPTDTITLASNFIHGPEQSATTGPKRVAWSNVLTVKTFDPLALSAEYTYGHEARVTPSLRSGTWQGVAAIASYGWTDRFSTAVRGEYMKDSDGVRTLTFADTGLGELTLTGAYKFTKMLLGRAEVRQDWSDRAVYQKGTANADKNQTTLALQLIYQF